MPRTVAAARTAASARTAVAARIAMRGWGNQSIRFDSTNDYVDFGTTDFAFERTQAFSVSAWIYPDPLPTVPNGIIISRANAATTFRGWWLRHVNASRAVEVFLSNDFAGGNIINVKTNPNTVDPKQWMRVGFSYDGTSLAAGIIFYIDGLAVSKVTTTDALSATIVDAGVAARMGTITDSTFDFGGNLTDVAVYTDVLTAAEFSQIHFNGIYPSDNLYARWKMTDGSGTTLTDDSGNGRNGTITAATWSTSYAPLQTARTVAS